MMAENSFRFGNKICDLCRGEVESLVRNVSKQNGISLFVLFLSPFDELSQSKKKSFYIFFSREV